MRGTLKTGPRLDKRLLLVALVNELLRRRTAEVVAHEARDAVVSQPVPRPNAVHVARKRPIGDAALVTHAVTAKACDGVQDIGGAEATGFSCFVPVPRLL